MLRRTVAMAILILTGLALLGGIIAIAWYLWRERDDWLIGLLILSLLATALIALMGMFRPRRNQGVSVLWCRRFAKHADPGGQRNRWNQLILTAACRDLAVPVTLRDDSVGWSHAVEKATDMPLGITFAVSGVAAYAFAAYPLIESLADFTVVYVAVAIGMVVGGVALIHWIMASLGSFRGSPDEMQALLRRVLKRRWWNTEALVVRCTNDDWQAHVDAFLASASVVIIDITGDSPNVDWEVQRSLERMGPDRVLFVRESVDAGAPSCDRTAPPVPMPSVEHSPHFLRYGRDWAIAERRAYFAKSEQDSASPAATPLGEGARALVAELRQWIQAALAGSDGSRA